MRRPLNISGMGLMSCFGRGTEVFEKALRETVSVPPVEAEGRAALRVPNEAFNDREVLKSARRADRFSKLALIPAWDAVHGSSVPLEELRASTGVIVATAFGTHATIFRFLDNIIDYGETNVSPTTFAHSIHNAAASYISGALKLRGPVMTVTQFSFAFYEAVLLAYAWLLEGRVKHVLVGVADECSGPMEYICEEKLNVSRGLSMNPLACAPNPVLVPSEGSAFFLFTLEGPPTEYGAITGMERGRDARGWSNTDLSVLCANGMQGSEESYKDIIRGQAASYSSLYGGLMTSGAFECAAAALMLKNGVIYGSPVDGTSPLEVSRETTASVAKSIQCAAHNCEGEKAFMRISKQPQP